MDTILSDKIHNLIDASFLLVSELKWYEINDLHHEISGVKISISELKEELEKYNERSI